MSKLITAADVPAALEILGRIVPIQLKRLKRTRDEEFVFGCFLANEQVIVIDPRHPRNAALLQDTLVHEAMHAVFQFSGLNGFTDAIPNLEEAVVRALASAFSKHIDMLSLTAKEAKQNDE
jgi:hypothetical protein